MKQVNLTVNHRKVSAPANIPVIQALWHAGEAQLIGVGCLQGVCGSCSILIQRNNRTETETALACQTLVEEGMQVFYPDPPDVIQHHYDLSKLASREQALDLLRQSFPEAEHCRSCGCCDNVCPKNIAVEKGVHLAVQNRLEEVAELFDQCILCDLCMLACPENIEPNLVGNFCRRVIARFKPLPPYLEGKLTRRDRECES